jgi:hypothetical protein
MGATRYRRHADDDAARVRRPRCRRLPCAHPGNVPPELLGFPAAVAADTLAEACRTDRRESRLRDRERIFTGVFRSASAAKACAAARAAAERLADVSFERQRPLSRR